MGLLDAYKALMIIGILTITAQHTMTTSSLQAFRSSIYHCLSDPGSSNNITATEYFDDGLMIIEHGHIAKIGSAKELLKQLPADIPVKNYTDKLILPGFIDTHTHYPQTEIIASYGEQLLEWLNKYTFPAEAKFADEEYAQSAAEFFLDETLKNGTTTACVMATVHPGSVDAIFSAAQQRKLRLIAGKVLMDRNAPDDLQDTAKTGYQQSKGLIEKWHKNDRLHYAITPRFAPTSTEEQLKQAGLLAAEYPDTYIHSHVAENEKEVAWVSKLFPWSRSYLDVYDHYGLLRDRSVYAHGIHLNDSDVERLQQTGAALAFCPTSNGFLGSGLFNLDRMRNNDVRVGLATDVGGGTSFSLLQTLNEAYKVQQLVGNRLPASRGIYLATLGGAESLYLDDKIGNFEVGKEADFIVMDYQATPLIKHRIEKANTIDEKLFILMMLGDDRTISATYIMGECVYAKEGQTYE